MLRESRSIVSYLSVFSWDSLYHFSRLSVLHLWNKIIMVCISFVNLTQPRITWADSLNEGLTTLPLPVSMSLGDCFEWINWCRKIHRTEGSTTLDKGHWTVSGEFELSTSKQTSEWAHTYSFLCSWLWIRHDQLSRALAAMTSPQWWTIT